MRLLSGCPLFRGKISIHLILAVDRSRIPEANRRARKRWKEGHGHPPRWCPSWDPFFITSEWVRCLVIEERERARDDDRDAFDQLNDKSAFSKRVDVLLRHQDIRTLSAYGPVAAHLIDRETAVPAINQDALIQDATGWSNYATKRKPDATRNHRSEITPEDAVQFALAGLPNLRGRTGVFNDFKNPQIEEEAKRIKARQYRDVIVAAIKVRTGIDLSKSSVPTPSPRRAVNAKTATARALARGKKTFQRAS